VGGIVAASVIFFSGGLTSAQTPEPGATGSTGSTGSTGPTGSTAAAAPSYDDLLAEELGVSVDELRAAQATARDRYLDGLVTAGDLTAEQAANLKATSPGDVLGHAMDNGFGYVRDLLLTELADAMGIDRQALEDGLSEGKSLEQIAQDNGVNADDIKADITSTVDQILNLAQQTGLLSEADAADLREDVQQFIDSAFSTPTEGN
jgi:predicted DNA-binding protein YlxM (UPF0122 family)